MNTQTVEQPEHIVIVKVQRANCDVGLVIAEFVIMLPTPVLVVHFNSMASAWILN